MSYTKKFDFRRQLKDMTLEEMDVFWEEAKTFNQTS